jgi:hypothetical protein
MRWMASWQKLEGQPNGKTESWYIMLITHTLHPRSILVFLLPQSGCWSGSSGWGGRAGCRGVCIWGLDSPHPRPRHQLARVPGW